MALKVRSTVMLLLGRKGASQKNSADCHSPQEKFFCHSAMRLRSGTAACCSASLWGIPLLTYWHPSVEAEYRCKAMKPCVSWEGLQGKLLWHKGMLWHWWDRWSRTFYVTFVFREVQGWWTCHQIRLSSLTIIDMCWIILPLFCWLCKDFSWQTIHQPLRYP